MADLCLAFVGLQAHKVGGVGRGFSACRKKVVVIAAADGGDEKGKDIHDIPESGRDWNAEWARFKETGSNPAPAPLDETLREPLKTSSRYQRDKAMREKKAIENSKKKVSRPSTIRQQLSQQKGFMNLPPWRVLQKDWRFWVAVILILSLSTSLLNSLGSSTAPVTGGYL
ncbi:hypothetical protein NDN08_000654 [Rhodosorus marinus]|uniref:Uncharacterized protein n=1 Tax=Rhodosorus marinus TaxID=101924 RepID=A0AAV8US81_9RHOD|nr:hypothetical protein NDN08_000654 [Rhodosorus marinus]